MKKTLVGVGSCAAAVVAISSAWGVADRVIESQRPWALRSVEVAVLDLQAEKLDRECKKLEERRFYIRLELRKTPGSQFLSDELAKVNRDILILQSRVPHCGK